MTIHIDKASAAFFSSIFSMCIRWGCPPPPPLGWGRPSPGWLCTASLCLQTINPPFPVVTAERTGFVTVFSRHIRLARRRCACVCVCLSALFRQFFVGTFLSVGRVFTRHTNGAQGLLLLLPPPRRAAAPPPTDWVDDPPTFFFTDHSTFIKTFLSIGILTSEEVLYFKRQDMKMCTFNFKT